MAVVYILTNPAMPGLVKIGFTERQIEERLKELSQVPGVPLPFECFLAIEVESYKELEKALHYAFGEKRINPKREFFEISPDRPASILKFIQSQNSTMKDVTPENDIVESQEELEALNNERRRKNVFNFSMVGISAGAILKSVFNPDIICVVKNERWVEFRGEEQSLSGSALIVAKENGRNWKAVQGAQYWSYNGKTLAELRSEMEQSLE